MPTIAANLPANFRSRYSDEDWRVAEWGERTSCPRATEADGLCRRRWHDVAARLITAFCSTHSNERGCDEMRKYAPGVCAMLLAFMLGPPGKLWADNTVSMELTGVTQSFGEYYIAPYLISVNGTTYSLICDDAYDEITMNESWTATTETFSNLTSSNPSNQALFYNSQGGGASGLTGYQEAGWLAEQIMANINDTTTAGEYQYALWELFDPSFSLTAAGVGGYEQAIDGDLAAAIAACGSPGSCSNSGTIYTPYEWSGQPQDRPQEFLAVAMPEPITFWSLLMVLAAIGVACKWMGRTSVKSSASVGV
jgi:hypothetical protein